MIERTSLHEAVAIASILDQFLSLNELAGCIIKNLHMAQLPNAMAHYDSMLLNLSGIVMHHIPSKS